MNIPGTMRKDVDGNQPPRDRGGQEYAVEVTKKRDEKDRTIERITYVSPSRQAKKATGLSARQFKKYRKDRSRKARAAKP